MVRWTWWDWSLALRLYFLQCFDTVGWVIWPVKRVPDMTYNVFSGTLNPAEPINLECGGEMLPPTKYHPRSLVAITSRFTATGHRKSSDDNSQFATKYSVITSCHLSFLILSMPDIYWRWCDNGWTMCMWAITSFWLFAYLHCRNILSS